MNLGLGLIAARAGIEADKSQKVFDYEQTRRQQETDARTDEKNDRNDRKNLRLSLADAARPVGVEQTPGAPMRPEAMDNRDVGLPENAGLQNAGLSLVTQYRVGGKRYDTRGLADVAAAVQNTPDAVANRQGQAYRLAGRPVDALDIEQKQAQISSANNAQARKLKEEGVFQTAQSMLGGDPNAVFEKFNAQGALKLKEPPQVMRRDIALAGYGTVPNYDYEGTIVDKDGKEQPFKVGSHDANMALLKYKDQLELASKGNDSVVKQQKVLGDISNATEKNRLTGEATVAKTEAAAAKAALASSGKPLPISAAKGILENQTNLRRAQTALALVNGETVDGATGDTAATGLKGLLPNQVLNRIDPTGVNARAAIADLGSLVIHDRSGAAVTAAEFPRLAPFIPGATDDAKTVKKKLALFTKNYQAIVDDASEFYRSSGYNVPTEVLRSNATPDRTTNANTGGASGSWAADKPRMTSTAEALKLPPGSLFVDANGEVRRRP